VAADDGLISIAPRQSLLFFMKLGLEIGAAVAIVLLSMNFVMVVIGDASVARAGWLCHFLW
jgi:hypothetical protein